MHKSILSKRNQNSNSLLTSISLLLLMFLVGCGQKSNTEQTTTTAPDGTTTTTTTSKNSKPGLIDRMTNKPVTLPAGTVITVRTKEALGSKISSPGQTFTASVASPVEVDGKIVIPDGSAASGTVVDAIPLGRFKGGARLSVRLNSVSVGGHDYAISTASLGRSIKGKGKRSAVMIGGGAGVGALIGGLAGGGKGAAIGAVAGGGAGTAGAAFTGSKEIVMPAESALSFKLTQPVEVKQ
jgi:hypothetical protein